MSSQRHYPFWMEWYTPMAMFGQLSKMRGKPFLSNLATIALKVVLPSAFVASLIYAPPDYMSPKKTLGTPSK